MYTNKKEVSYQDYFQIDTHNLRLVVNNYPTDFSAAELTDELVKLSKQHYLSKIWLWAYPDDVPAFVRCGFQQEGQLTGKHATGPTVSLAYYVDTQRSKSRDLEMEDGILAQVKALPLRPLLPLSAKLEVRLLDLRDSSAISRLMSQVFVSYPTPLDQDYIKTLITKSYLFYGAFSGEELVSMAAAYPDRNWGRCEITDCATLPDFRGWALTERLINLLETEVCQLGPYVLYTLARATLPAVNRVFHRIGFNYRGRLINNCDIAGALEDMNLWVKEE